MTLYALPNPAQSSAARASALRASEQERLRRYAGYLDFYNGKQWAKTRPGRTSLVVNYTRAVVDKGVSYLLGQGINFAVPAGIEDAETRGLGDRGKGRENPELRTQNPEPAQPSYWAARAEALLYRVYEDNDLEAADAQGAINGAVLGDTVFKVFWESGAWRQGSADRGWGVNAPSGTFTGDGGRIRVVNIDPFTFFPRWAADDPSALLSVDVVYQLPVEEAARRYGDISISPNSHPLIDAVESWTNSEFALTVGDWDVVRSANPYGFIPFVHIPNARPANEFWGVSDLKDVAPLNRELNERMSDVADVIRFHSDPPVIFKGVREHGNLAVGPGTVWDLPEGAGVDLLEWRGQPPAVQEHIERVLRALHDVAETPKTAFGDSGRLLSGVALETELQPLIQKTLRKRIWWSAGLRRRNRYILRIAELNGMGSFAPYRSRIIWPPLLPADNEAEVRNNVALVQAGLRSRRTAMDHLGDESPETELRLIEEERRSAPTTTNWRRTFVDPIRPA